MKFNYILPIFIFLLTECSPSRSGNSQQKTILGLLLLSGNQSAVSCKNYASSYTVSGTALGIAGYSAGTSNCSFNSSSKKLTCTGTNPETKTYSSVSDFINGRPLTYSYDSKYDTGGTYTGYTVYTYESSRRMLKSVTTFSDNSYINTKTFSSWDSSSRGLEATSNVTGCNLSYIVHSYTGNTEIMTVTANGGGLGCSSGKWTSVKTFDSNQNLISQTITGIISSQANFTLNATLKACE